MIPPKKLLQMTELRFVKTYKGNGYVMGQSIRIEAGTVIDVGRWRVFDPQLYSAIIMGGMHKGAHVVLHRKHTEPVSPLVALAFEAE